MHCNLNVAKPHYKRINWNRIKYIFDNDNCGRQFLIANRNRGYPNLRQPHFQPQPWLSKSQTAAFSTATVVIQISENRIFNRNRGYPNLRQPHFQPQPRLSNSQTTAFSTATVVIQISDSRIFNRNRGYPNLRQPHFQPQPWLSKSQTTAFSTATAVIQISAAFSTATAVVKNETAVPLLIYIYIYIYIYIFKNVTYSNVFEFPNKLLCEIENFTWLPPFNIVTPQQTCVVFI